ncbi:MAG: ABC transporter permease [Verrucomicrobiaceae bacterium]|nr:ABC transporter permease [Verrucomicrobiaceae bacterium]
MIPRIVKYVLHDILRSRIAIGYTLFLFVAATGLFNIGGDVNKGLVSILSVVLMLVPLMSLVFATIHFYNSYEFIELLSSQPLRRTTILLGEYVGVAAALGMGFLVGVGLPIVLYDRSATGLHIVGVGLLLTFVFVAIAFLGAVCTRDKARGMGVALLLWFFFAIIFDCLVLYVLFRFQDYPLEKATIGMVALNPIDLARIIVLLRMDASALMGQTGAIMQEFLGSALGIGYSVGVLLLWIAVPLALALRVFRKKDL